MFISGSNGSGKTTLLRILAGLVHPSRGSVNYNCSQYWKLCIGYSGHYPSLYEDLTVLENLRYYATLYGIPSDHIETRAWIQLKLDSVASQTVGSLSFGWRKRVDIIRATLHRPRILLLDEPFTGLDPDASSTLSGLIDELASKGMGIIMTSPRRDDEYSRLSHREMVIRDGRLINI